MAKEITGRRCQPARGPVGGERTAASQTCFRGSESDVRDSEGVRRTSLGRFLVSN